MPQCTTIQLREMDIKMTRHDQKSQLTTVKLKMEPRVVIHEIPKDSQVVLATFRSLEASVRFIKELPLDDMTFPNLCMKAGATDIAGALTMYWVKFPTPDHACYFAMEMDQMNYKGKIVSESAGRLRSPSGLKRLHPAS